MAGLPEVMRGNKHLKKYKNLVEFILCIHEYGDPVDRF